LTPLAAAHGLRPTRSCRLIAANRFDQRAPTRELGRAARLLVGSRPCRSASSCCVCSAVERRRTCATRTLSAPRSRCSTCRRRRGRARRRCYLPADDRARFRRHAADLVSRRPRERAPCVALQVERARTLLCAQGDGWCARLRGLAASRWMAASGGAVGRPRRRSSARRLDPKSRPVAPRRVTRCDTLSNRLGAGRERRARTSRWSAAGSPESRRRSRAPTPVHALSVFEARACLGGATFLDREARTARRQRPATCSCAAAPPMRLLGGSASTGSSHAKPRLAGPSRPGTAARVDPAPSAARTPHTSRQPVDSPHLPLAARAAAAAREARRASPRSTPTTRARRGSLGPWLGTGARRADRSRSGIS